MPLKLSARSKQVLVSVEAELNRLGRKHEETQELRARNQAQRELQAFCDKLEKVMERSGLFHDLS